VPPTIANELVKEKKKRKRVENKMRGVEAELQTWQAHEECDNKKELVEQLKEARKRITSLEKDNQRLEVDQHMDNP
ncbi:unnamed protein product, partial [Dovyalis caffra]